MHGLAKRSRGSARSAVAANYNNLMATADEFFYSVTLKAKNDAEIQAYMLRLFVAHWIEPPHIRTTSRTPELYINKYKLLCTVKQKLKLSLEL